MSVDCERSLLGSTIEEKTRSLLGWTHSPQQQTRTRHHPYPRPMRPSSSSSCSSSSSTTSSQPSSPSSPQCSRSARDVQVFERLRQLLPDLPSDRNAFQTLITMVSQVMDLEQQLEELNEKTEDVRSRLLHKSSSSSSVEESVEVFPDDLANVDVSAFAHLIYSEPLPFFDYKFLS